MNPATNPDVISVIDPVSVFRCPFQIKGEKEGTIVEVHLNDDQNTRLKLILTAFEYFHTHPESISIRFHLPQSLLEKCSSNTELKDLLFQYQVEIVSTELSYRLNPFFVYQIKQHTKEEMVAFYEKAKYKLVITQKIEELGIDCFKHSINEFKDLMTLVEVLLLTSKVKGAMNNPKVGILYETTDGNASEIAEISLSSITLQPEWNKDYVDPKNNQNCFGIVTTPFYPKEFARYSDDITIVMSRMVDFFTVSSEQRKKIRHKVNSVYQAYGVPIIDLENDKQPDGLWIPEFTESKIV